MSEYTNLVSYFSVIRFMAASLPVSETDEKQKGGLKLFIKKKNEVYSYTVVEIEINGCFEKYSRS